MLSDVDTREDPHALAWEREHEAKVWTHVAKPMVVTPPCAAWGIPSIRIELLAPVRSPPSGSSGLAVRASIKRQRQPGQRYLLFKGVAAYNGYGKLYHLLACEDTANLAA